MKAFLSHSSKDKDFVAKVFEQLGPLLAEYDAQTFDYTLNVAAIREAISRSDVFVAFLSKNSTSSPFVREEYRQALEGLGKGGLASVLIFALDDTSYTALPEWLREFNVVTRQSSPQACARRIQARLLEVDAARGDSETIYLGRDGDEALVRKALTVAPAQIPLAVHVVGHHGIGRRTFVEKTFKKVLPRVFTSIVPITVQKHDGAEELFRSLYAAHVNSTKREIVESFSNFSSSSADDKIDKISDLIRAMNADGEFLMFIDDGGVYDEEGDYQPVFAEVLTKNGSSKRPLFSVVQSRMMPTAKRMKHPRTFHHSLKHLDDDAVREILSFLFQELELDYTSDELSKLVDMLDGHPFNIRFCVEFAVAYGIKSLLADPRDLMEWKRRRAGDFLDKMEFNEVEGDILALLTEYRHVSDEMVPTLVEREDVDTIASLRRLQDFCCIELREGYFFISPPIRDAVTKDARFERPLAWKKAVGAKICDIVSQYEDDDHLPLSIIESATIAAAQGTSAPAFISSLIMPSHVLRIGRDHYDRRRWVRAIEFSERAFEGRDRLPTDAQIEALRIIALAASRIDRSDLYGSALDRLAQYTTNYARRVAYFVQGFHARNNNDLDGAEAMYKSAWNLARKNESINRELANIYCKQKRYNEAEPYARAAFAISPTSPYILDILAETLLGKERQGLTVDPRELDRVLSALQRYGDAPGSSFYVVRLAQQLIKSGDPEGAIGAATRAVNRTPELLTPYFIRADAYLAARKPGEAAKDLKLIKDLLSEAGGSYEGDLVKAVELEVHILLDQDNPGGAKAVIDQQKRFPAQVRNRLLNEIAKAVSFSPDSVDSSLRSWAKRALTR